jgi:hypothetical protein
VLPATAKRPVLTTAEVAVLGDTDAITVGKLCDEFERYVKAHPEEYRDQTNPPKRIAEIKEMFGDHAAATLKSSEIEDWLDEIQEERSLANATINKMRGTLSMLFKHGKRKCSGPGCSDSFRRFLSGRSVFRFRLPEVLAGG